jgi:hypothetical protein
VLRGLSADERARLVLGPSSELRAPTLLVGDLVLVGFHPDAYGQAFG